MADPCRRDGDDLLVAIRLSPRAAREKIGGVWTDADGKPWLQASVTAPPDRGRANAALIALLAARLKIAPSSIFLETGDVSRLKRLRILDCTPAIAQALETIASEERNKT